jgi:photosystem II stability/assembly factor-like uncharacterized protein
VKFGFQSYDNPEIGRIDSPGYLYPMRFVLTGLFFFFSQFLFSQSPAKLADSLKSGFRGLSIVNEKVIWMSGRKGLVGNTTTGGKKWKWYRVKGFESLDFRSLHAFDSKHAVIASAGTPAVILETTNGGKSWNQTFRSDDSAMFFDGMEFWDTQRGIIFGDPVNGRLFLMETTDGGKTWKEIPFENRPKLENGEAAFAASGTTIRVLPGGHVWIATGGAKARLFHSRDYGRHWLVRATPMLAGEPSQGIFSFAFRDTMNGVIVGGDYTQDTLRRDHVFFTNDGGKTWNAPCLPTGGYRSCVEYINDTIVVATGTSGTDISYDGGLHWRRWENMPGSNVVKSPAFTKNIYFAGNKKSFLRITDLPAR